VANNDTYTAPKQVKYTHPKHHIGTTMVPQNSQAIEANAQDHQTQDQQPTKDSRHRSGQDHTSQAPEKAKHAHSQCCGGAFIIVQADEEIEANAQRKQTKDEDRAGSCLCLRSSDDRTNHTSEQEKEARKQYHMQALLIL